VNRIGKLKMRELLVDLTENLPEYEVEPDLYSDWGDPRLYSLGDIGKGECSGEVVTQYEFGMTAVERIIFESQVKLEEGNVQEAGRNALKAMIKGAKALVQIQYDDVTEDDPDEIMDEFRERYYDTEIFFDPFAGPKFADYLFAAYEAAGKEHTADSAHHLIEESQLFVEAVHSCYNRIRTEGLTQAGAT